ncbi:MAG: hypothetical protein HZB62_04105 [Nitrospirae bacterium]|nr:hypothetical protein [Nitrospirota bacterium]
MKSAVGKIFCFVIALVSCLFLPGAGTFAGEPGHHDSHHGQMNDMHSDKVEELSSFLIQIEKGAAPWTAQNEVAITFRITDGKGRPAENLTISHERILHVIIISEDLSSFAHIHPEDFGPITDEMMKNARYSVRYAFPKAGRYLVAVDTAAEGTHVSKQFHVTVDGIPKMASIKRDFTQRKSFGGYDVSLKSIPEKLRAGEKNLLRYAITRNGEPVKDLEQYLGAPMHLAVVMTDLNGFIHAHGDVPGASHDHSRSDNSIGTVREKVGPEIESDVVFPKRGTYNIFSQIQQRGKVILLDFMVKVE